MSSLMPISVITVVYNDISHIKSTMDSVISQDYPKIEYIIIDGNSTDGTKEFIESSIKSMCDIALSSEDKCYIEATHRTKTGFTFKFLSQKDDGIYDAMNKGIDLLSGTWCNFMNCGDTFYAADTISSLFTKLLEIEYRDNIHVIYGNTNMIFDDTHSVIRYGKDTKPVTYSHHFVHQSAFIKKELCQTKYNTNFKLASDAEFFVRAYNAGMGFKYIPVVVSNFDANGVSSKPSFQAFKEICAICAKYNRLYLLHFSLRYIFLIVPRGILTTIIPSRLKNRFRVIASRKYS